MTEQEREKVIKGLGKVSTNIIDGYITEPDEACNVINDAIALLKAQEPLEAIVCINDISGAGSWWYQCPRCKMPIDPKDKYCKDCGQAVKWI